MRTGRGIRRQFVRHDRDFLRLYRPPPFAPPFWILDRSHFPMSLCQTSVEGHSACTMRARAVGHRMKFGRHEYRMLVYHKRSSLEGRVDYLPTASWAPSVHEALADSMCPSRCAALVSPCPRCHLLMQCPSQQQLRSQSPSFRFAGSSRQLPARTRAPAPSRHGSSQRRDR